MKKTIPNTVRCHVQALVKEQMLKVADRVDRAEIFEECGHSLALEADERLASLLCEFMLSR